MKVKYRDPVLLLQDFEEIQREECEECVNFIYSKDNEYYHISVPLVNGMLHGKAKMECVARVVASLSYKDNQINGECILYHENGNIMEIVQVVNGWKNGQYFQYNQDGQAIEEGYYTSNITEQKAISSSGDDYDYNGNGRDNRHGNDHPGNKIKDYTTAALITTGIFIVVKSIIRSRL